MDERIHESVTLAPPPAVAWEEKTRPALALELPRQRWTLVEFWAQDCLFGRLFTPVRRALRARYENRCPLFRCEVRSGQPACEEWGVTALPIIVLFARGKWKRRWIGDIHPCVISLAIDRLWAEDELSRNEHDD